MSVKTAFNSAAHGVGKVAAATAHKTLGVAQFAAGQALSIGGVVATAVGAFAGPLGFPAIVLGLTASSLAGGMLSGRGLKHLGRNPPKSRFLSGAKNLGSRFHHSPSPAETMSVAPASEGPAIIPAEDTPAVAPIYPRETPRPKGPGL